MAKRKLSFYDHHRQDYHDAVWRPEHNAHIGEIMVGDYARDGGVDRRGELKLKLYRFERHESLSVQVCAFDDSFGTLRELDASGVLRAIERATFETHEDVSRMLIEHGLRDRSDTKLEAA